MNTVVTQKGESGRLEVNGNIDEKGAEIFKTRLQELKHMKNVEIDFSNVEYIGSAGIGKILMFYKRIAAHGGKLSITHVSADLYRLFRELKLDTVFTITSK